MPSEPDRKAAIRELIEDLDSLSASASHIPDEEMDALIDEARVHTPATELSPEEWIRQFREWAHSHRTDTPLLSDEAISRESIYSD
jgi:hypothetical protein